MKIKQILNNNAVLVTKGTNELVVLANGVGFSKKIGQKISESEVNKIFVLETHEMVEHFSYQLSKTDPELLLLIEKIVKFAKEKYDMQVRDYIYLTLLDHIDYTLKRFSEGVEFDSPLHWEIKRFYRREHEIGKKALEFIYEYAGCLLPENEASAIALHFVNIRSNKINMNETARVTKIIHDLTNIVKYEFKVIFDEDSFDYSRFITHLHYFAQRIVFNEAFSEDGENDLYLQLKNLYPLAYKCVQKIKLYVYNTHHILMSENEEVYLMVHIQRITHRSKGE
ncbi:PRD domain-containing protein [Konateibacter massiliensis]|uniref:PRD domain-containing protein n=1 Tax=Konateibacter massiliensis TaxID=2002841 RepID=UPI000C155825|nr:PRD domain-containing protein [Konateibacter massiliensis]